MVNLVVRMVKCGKSGCEDGNVNLVVRMVKCGKSGCEDGKVGKSGCDGKW